MFSRTCQHAIRAMVFIAQQEGSTFVSSQRVSQELLLPGSFLSKVLSRLTAAELLLSHRGPSGGVKLAHPAEEIRLIDVVEAVDGLQSLATCLFGWPDCHRSSPCPLHSALGQATDPVVEMMSSVSLRDMAEVLDGSSRKIEH